MNSPKTIKILNKIKEELEKQKHPTWTNNLSNDEVAKNLALDIAIAVVSKLDLNDLNEN